MNRNTWIDYLRSSLTVLVVAHHASLAYTTFAHFDTTIYINSTAPVVDNNRWIGLDIFENFNDIFFMSLMYLVSGLFVFKSIQKKRTKTFLIDRMKRLGIPFLITVSLVIPIAYVPSYYLAHHNFQLLPFIKDYLFVEQWPVGPPWFIWLLLAFNIIAAAIPPKVFTSLSVRLAQLAKKPALFIFSFFACVCISFIPLSIWIGQYTWTGFGPFDFQVNRVLLYFLFFIFGACLGVSNWQEFLFRSNKLFGKQYLFWIAISLVCYTSVELLTYFGYLIVDTLKLSTTTGYIIFDIFFAASCVSSSFALIALSNQKMNLSNKTMDNLSKNAYGIYLVHYVFITWMQFALLQISLPAVIKFLIVFVISIGGSWWIINLFRKIKTVNNLI